MIGRILSVDLGEKRVGVAVSDPLGITAQGLDTILRAKDGSDIERMRVICAEKKVVKCVVGLPLNMTGDMGPKAKETLEWVELLKTKIPCPVETWDERLTSRQATRLMIEQGLSRKRQKENSDELSAILILQSYLDCHCTPLTGDDAD